MRPQRRSSGPPAKRVVAIAGLMVTILLTLTGCAEEVQRGWLPRGASTSADIVRTFWIWTWVAALVVGALVTGLLLYCVVMFRRKRTDVGLPEQLRYHVPLEVLYTVVPIMMVGVIWYFTYQYDKELVHNDAPGDVKINVVGKQWSWDFNYMDSNVYESGVQANLTGQPGVEKTLPTLYVPVGKRVEFVLTARDVIHSFWVPAFHHKLDMIPGRVNRLFITPTEIGTYQGKCAELCGRYHGSMLFNLKVVPQQEYDRHMAELKARGQVGQLPNGYSRTELMPADRTKAPEVGTKP